MNADAGWFQREAKKFGPQTLADVQATLRSRRYPQHAYRSCLGILNLARKSPQPRLEKACQTLLQADLLSYRDLKAELARLEAEKTPPKPVRRVWIPKPGTSEKRPLGILTMKNRAEQTLVKLALEPEWEAKFEPNSYGFRSGRSCHDAITAIHININKQPTYVLDTDISKCFDKIAHPPLLRNLETFPSLSRQIKGWLTAGMMDGAELFANTTGVPQGSPLSPLLANVALRGQVTAQILISVEDGVRIQTRVERLSNIVLMY